MAPSRPLDDGSENLFELLDEVGSVGLVGGGEVGPQPGQLEALSSGGDRVEQLEDGARVAHAEAAHPAVVLDVEAGPRADRGRPARRRSRAKPGRQAATSEPAAIAASSSVAVSAPMVRIGASGRAARSSAASAAGRDREPVAPPARAAPAHSTAP